jgi:hypothetical protein
MLYIHRLYLVGLWGSKPPSRRAGCAGEVGAMGLRGLRACGTPPCLGDEDEEKGRWARDGSA